MKNSMILNYPSSMIKKLLILLAFINPFGGFAQTLYEFQFDDADGQNYLGFMVYWSESDAYMRVSFTDAGGEYNVVDVKYTAVTGKNENGNYCVFLGSEPKFIVGNSTVGYLPDTFVWIWGDDGVYNLPYVTSDPDFSEESFRQVKSYTELDVATLTEEYIHQFYYSDEADYLSFVSMVGNTNEHTLQTDEYNYDNYNYDDYNSNSNTSNSNANVTTNSNEITFHFMIVANTEIGDIGKSCDVDKRNYVSEFEGVAEALGLSFKPYIIDGKNFTKTKVNEALKNMNVGANDIVFFVYTGHGFRWSDQTDDYPMLDMRYNVYQKIAEENAIGLSDIYTKIKAKGGRLSIVFGDCCNSDVGINQRTNSTFLASRSNPNFKKEKLEKLFLNSTGSLIVTAASPGEVSWSNDVNGGFFTSSFLSAFHEEISYLSSDIADWDGLIKKTKENAKYKSAPTTCSVCTAQNAVTQIKVAYK
jgi:hypothetical protein